MMKKTLMKSIICISMAAIMLFTALPAFAEDVTDLWDPSIPNSAKAYGSGTCHYGFTTSRYLSKPAAGFGNNVKVSSNYIKWDGDTDYDFFLYAKPKDQNGNYMRSDWGFLYCGFGGRINYSIWDIAPLTSATKLYLRVENPGYTNGQTNYHTGNVINNMQCNGKFWL
jgi:hypothetical protein